MKVKRYEASNMQEALMKIREDLGSEAIILHAKKFTRGGFLRLWGAKEMVEVLAATEVNIGDHPGIVAEINEKFRSIQSELKEMKTFVHTLIKQMTAQQGTPHFEPPLSDLYLRLLQNEVEEKLAEKVVRELEEKIVNNDDKSPENLQSFLLSKITNLLGEPAPIELDNDSKVVALIGPTGVGKTTTIAKLAANFVLQGEKKVAFVTADTYRIAAIDQLKTYAEIIGVPVEVVFTPSELKTGIEKHLDKDLILIDTPGRSQKNTNQMYELKDFLDSSRPHSVHLVLSATTKYKDLLDVIERFSIVPIDKIIFTKLDETNNFGCILNVCTKMKKQISYLTTGQNVPEDIEIPDSKRLAKLILGVENG